MTDLLPPELTQEYVKTKLHYNPETGVFTWLVGSSNNVVAGAKAGYLAAKGYIKTSLDRREIFAHRLAWLYMTGSFPEGVIDHIDGNPANNAWSNLRDVTVSENGHNRHKLNSNNKSGVQGVSFAKRYGDWVVQVTNPHTGKVVWGGGFKKKEDAIKARRAMTFSLPPALGGER